jgi:hypothetical protein
MGAGRGFSLSLSPLKFHKKERKREVKNNDVC